MGKIPKLLSPQEDLDFRRDVIGHLLASIGGEDGLKAQFEQFLSKATANADHKKLAYHLFCSVTVYISKHTTLNEQQDFALRSLIRQLHQEWINDDAPPKYSKTPSHIETIYFDDVCIGQCASFAAAGPSGVSTVAVVKAATIDTSDVTRGDTIDTNDVDINEMCEAFERTSIARSTTPPGFVRGAEKYVPGTPNFHRDVSLKDAVDLKYRYPFGHRLMAKHGYHDQGGLGLDGSGIQRPIDAHKLANEVRDRESSIGLGYKPKGKGKAPVNGHSTFVTEEPTTGLTGLAVAWKKCVADPHAGDKTAQKGYTINGAKHSAAQATTHGKGAANQANTTTITYKEYIIKDTWKDRAKSNGHSPNEEAQGQTSEVASIMQDSGRAIPKQVTDCTSTTAGTNVKKYLPGRKNWTRASDSRKEAQKEVTQRSMNDLPTPPRGWVWKDGALKPDLDPRRADNPESNLFG